MTSPLGGLGTARFLDEFWQQKPCLIRKAFRDFVPQLDADDVAGLACDELAESRLVTGSFPEHDWTLRYGPFSAADLTALSERNWTLLVQDVEKHYPPLRSLLSSFDFLPSWRIDDLMISVSGDGGSVGPHVDQYDVFLLQATGQKRWQTALRFDSTLLPDCELNVLARFEAEKEWLLDAGDMLYLPPNTAHHGIALGEGMTWSIGLRAPSAADLLQAFGEWLATQAGEGERYRDGSLDTVPLDGEIDAAAITRLQSLMSSSMEDDIDFHNFLGVFLSRYRLAHEPAPSDEKFDTPSLTQALRGGACVQTNPWTRMVWIRSGSGARLFASGDAFYCTADLAQRLCGNPLEIPTVRQQDAATMTLLCELLNRGHLYLQYPE
jgi:50S ribosomal protein L16 3-hydroxylase